MDIKRWEEIVLKSILHEKRGKLYLFIRLMTFFPEYRNLFYFRIGVFGRLLALSCKPISTLLIGADEIGPGLFIQHGFCTIISARSIGRNCWINQQVTIGYSNIEDCPILGDDVVVNAGAKIIGNVRVGNRTTVGANAVVVKDVPDNCTVVGVPAYIVRRNGIRTREKL